MANDQSAASFRPLDSYDASPIEKRHTISRTSGRISVRVMHIITGVGQGGAEKLLSDLILRSPHSLIHSVLTLTGDLPFFDMGTDWSSLGLRRGQLSPRALWRLRQAIVDFRPDILHSWLYHANLAAGIAAPTGLPQLWSIHNTNLPRRGAKTLTRLTARLGGMLSKVVPTRTIYCSAAAATWHMREFGYSPRNTQIIENGVDFRAFAFDPAARARLRAAWRLNPDDIAIGSIGRFSPQKDHATVAAALQQLNHQNLIWVLAGEGCSPENAELGKLRGGMRSIALGPRHDMPALLSALDLLVIGSAFGEALPIVGLEAVANGLAVVSTRLGDAPILVASPGHLARPADAADLRRAIAAALPPLRGTAAAEELRTRLHAQYDIGTTAESYYRLYSEIFASSKANSAHGPAQCQP